MIFGNAQLTIFAPERVAAGRSAGCLTLADRSGSLSIGTCARRSDFPRHGRSADRKRSPAVPHRSWCSRTPSDFAMCDPFLSRVLKRELRWFPAEMPSSARTGHARIARGSLAHAGARRRMHGSDWTGNHVSQRPSAGFPRDCLCGDSVLFGAEFRRICMRSLVWAVQRQRLGLMSTHCGPRKLRS